MGAQGYTECLETIRIDLLEILGKSYIIQHCVAFLKRKSEEDAFRMYIAEGVKILTENTAKQFGGSALSISFRDIISGEKPDERTEEDIINGLKEKLKGKK